MDLRKVMEKDVGCLDKCDQEGVSEEVVWGLKLE